MFGCAVRLAAPPALRLERIRQRARRRYGARVCPGGDLFAQEQQFYRFVASRSFARMERWEKTLSCPGIAVENVGALEKTVEEILTQYRTLFPFPLQGRGTEDPEF